MVELERTMDPIRLSVMRSVLTDADIQHFVFDDRTGAILQGVIPVRLMVHEDDVELARRAIAGAGL